MKKILALLISYFVFIAQALATTGVPDVLHWEKAGFGGGGHYSMVVSDNFTADKIYAIPDVQAPYVSSNKGETWTPLSYNGPSFTQFGTSQTGSFVQSKNDANLMFAMDSVSAGGLYKSSNGGQSWKKVGNYRSPGKGSKLIAINPNDDNYVYTYLTGTIYRSTDKGETFSSYISLPFDSRASAYTTSSACSAAGASWVTSLNKCVIGIQFIYVDGVHNDLWLGSKNFGMVKYDMDTDTQSYIDLTGTNAKYNVSLDTYVDGSSVENLCVTAGWKIACTSDFSTWNYTAALSSDSNYFINVFAIHRKADTSINIVANRQLKSSVYTNVTHYSTDGGTTWATSSRTNNTTMNPIGVVNFGNAIGFLEDDKFNDGVMYLASDARVYRSDNSGQNFYEKNERAQMNVAEEIAIAPNGRIFGVSMDLGVQYSDDFGATWTQGVPNASQPYVTGGTNDYGGHYWRVITAGTKEEWDAGQGKVFITATMYGTNSTLYYKNTVIRSLDSGATWSRTFTGLPTAALYGDIIWDHGYARSIGLSADQTTLYVGMDGENCDADGTGGLPSDGCSANGSNHTFGGLFMSTDNAATFTRVWSSPRKIYNALAVDPTDTANQILMFGTFGYNLYRKTGASTSNYVGDSNGPGNYIYDVAYDSQGTPYAVTSASGAAIYKSVVTAYGDGSGQYGTWIKIKQLTTTGIADGLLIDKQNDKRVFVSSTLGSVTDRKVWVTPNADKDAQATWYDITGDLPANGGCQSLAINYFEGTQGYLYCSSNGGGWWKLNLADSPASTPNRTCFGGCND